MVSSSLQILLLLLVVTSTEAFLSNHYDHHHRRETSIIFKQQHLPTKSMIFSALPASSSHEELSSSTDGNSDNAAAAAGTLLSVEDAIFNRYACTRFQPNATNSSLVLEQAYQALDSARRAPSGFNVQPYKLLLVHNQQQKNAMSKYCCGHNAHRVRESVCTVLFLADRQALRLWKDYQNCLSRGRGDDDESDDDKDKKLSFSKRLANLKTMLYVALFSSGFPYLPQLLAGPLSFAIGLAMRVISWISRSFYPVPTLTSSLTWSTKNTMLVAMSYMLSCTSRGVATCPMEGYTTWGIRKVLKIPRRYSIPLIVSTGVPFRRKQEVGQDDVGMSHGPPSSGGKSSPRFRADDVIYGDLFGNSGSKLLKG